MSNEAVEYRLDTHTRRRQAAFLAALLGVIAVCAYAPSMGGGYIYDDRLLIERNPYVHSLDWWQRWFTTDFWDIGQEAEADITRRTYYRPLVTATYALDWLFGGYPDPFHVTNLFWHGAASILTFYTLRRWVGSTVPALLGALLLSIHPTKAESVAWISGRPDLMCMVFVLLASAGMARRVRRQRFGAALEAAGTLGAYLSKEAALILVVLPAVEVWVAAGRPTLTTGQLRTLLRAALTQFVVAGVYLGLRIALLPLGQNIAVESQVRALHNRPQIVLETFGRAVELVVAPRDMYLQRALVTFDDHGQLLLSTPYAVLGSVAILVLVGCVLASRKRLPGVALGLGVFLIGFLPTSNVLPTELRTLISERFLYIPMLGLGLALACVLDRYLTPTRAVPVMASCGLAAAALAFGSLGRAADYKDEQAYWTHELRVNPNSLAAINAQVEMAVKGRDIDAALRWLKRGHAVSHRVFRGTGSDVTFLTRAIELLAATTPDADRKKLARLAELYRQLAEARPGRLVFSDPRVEFSLNVTPSVAKLLREQRDAFVFVRGELLARLGQDAAALELVEAALRRCPDCRLFLARGPRIFAAAGNYNRATELLQRYGSLTGEDAPSRSSIESATRWAMQRAAAGEGPKGTVARAMELSALGFFGRAYEIMAPHEREFASIRSVAIGFAELAWRTGHEATARRILGNHMPDERASKVIAGWTATGAR